MGRGTGRRIVLPALLLASLGLASCGLGLPANGGFPALFALRSGAARRPGRDPQSLRRAAIATARLIAREARAVGVEVAVRSTPYPRMIERLTATFHWELAVLTIRESIDPDGAGRLPAWEREVDEAWRSASLDPAAQALAFERVDRLWRREAPWISLDSPGVVETASERLGNFKPRPASGHDWDSILARLLLRGRSEASASSSPPHARFRSTPPGLRTIRGYGGRPMRKPIVAVTDDRFGSYEIERGVFAGHGIELVVLEGERERRDTLREADGVLVNQYRLGGEEIEGLARCRIISRYGTGYDNVDVDAATRRGIWVARVPDYCHEEVADHALALLLACVRRLPLTDRGVHGGEWNVHAGLKTRRIAGKTLGIVGYGWTGRALHRKVAGLGLGRVLVSDHRLTQGDLADPAGFVVSFAELLRESDFVSLHIPLRAENRHLIDRASIRLMKPGAILVNTSRGPVVDQEALVEALRERRLDSAGLDVFELEPPIADTTLRSLDNAILTDHCAYYSEESLAELKEKAARNVLEVLLGRAPLYPVNRPLGASDERRPAQEAPLRAP